MMENGETCGFQAQSEEIVWGSTAKEQTTLRNNNSYACQTAVVHAQNTCNEIVIAFLVLFLIAYGWN